jgi:hypothetical protein
VQPRAQKSGSVLALADLGTLQAVLGAPKSWSHVILGLFSLTYADFFNPFFYLQKSSVRRNTPASQLTFSTSTFLPSQTLLSKRPLSTTPGAHFINASDSQRMYFPPKEAAARYMLGDSPLMWFHDSPIDQRDLDLIRAEPVALLDYSQGSFVRKI